MASSDPDYRDRRRRSRSRDRYRSRHDRHRYEDDSRERHRRRRSYDRDDDKYYSRRRRDRSASASSEEYRGRRRSPDDRRRHHRDRDRERRRRDSRSGSPSRSPDRGRGRERAPLPSQQDAFHSQSDSKAMQKKSPPREKEKPNFANTGALAAETNTVTIPGGGAAGTAAKIVLKYHEPPEARKPPASDDWRLYVFKGDDLLDTVRLSDRSCWLIGREKLVVDFPLEHPSCSKQHAAIQFRYVETRDEFGERTGKVRPYLIDLESSNGSVVNDEIIPPARYVELRDKDVLRFGRSSREYVVMLARDEDT